MYKNRHLLLIVLILLLNVGVQAGHGLTNEVFMTRQWRDLETPRSLIVNPSFATYCDWITVSSALSMAQLNEFYLANLQAIIPLTPLAFRSHTIGVGYVGYTSGKFDNTAWRGNRVVREEDGNKYSEHYGTISYSMRPLSFLSVGANINIVHQTNFDDPVTDGGFDLGISFLLDNVKWGKHVFGISVQNPAGISRYEVPVFTPDFGISWGGEKDIKSIVVSGGLEYNYHSFRVQNYGCPRHDVTGRVGTRLNKLLEIFLQGGRDYFGFSVNFHFDTTSRMLPQKVQSASAAMQVLFTKEQMAPTNTIYLAGEFGKNRNVIRGEVEEIYLKARKKLAEENYLDAYALFSLLEKEYPKFIKIDEVRMLSAYSLEKMYLYGKSIEKYNQTKLLYTHKNKENEMRIIGAANLGLLRAYRHVEDSQMVVKQFHLLQKSTALDSLKGHGHYELGQLYLSNKNWFDATAAFKKVETDHPDYPFAQYSMVVSDEMDNLKNIAPTDTVKLQRGTSRSWLKEAIGFKAVTEEQKEIQHKAMYLLGCIDYENGEYENAHKQLMRIPDTSDVYYDGLHVIAWALFKSKQWGKAREAALVMQNSKKLDVQADGYLIEGYSLLFSSEKKLPNEKKLERSKMCTEKALALLPQMENYLTVDINKHRSAIDSLVNTKIELVDDYNQKLRDGIERQFVYKAIEEFSKKEAAIQEKIEFNLSEIDNTLHYQALIDRITLIIEDAEYMRAVVERWIMNEKRKNATH